MTGATAAVSGGVSQPRHMATNKTAALFTAGKHIRNYSDKAGVASTKKNKKNFYGAKVVCCELKYILSYRVKRSVEFSPAATPLALMESHTSRSEAPLLLPPLPSPPLPACLPACLPLPFALTRSQSHGG